MLRGLIVATLLSAASAGSAFRAKSPVKVTPALPAAKIAADDFGYHSPDAKTSQAQAVPSMGDVTAALFQDKLSAAKAPASGRAGATQQVLRPASSGMRFAGAAARTNAAALPANFLNPGRSMYGMGSPYGRGALDNSMPMYGSFGRTFGPIGGPATSGSGMGGPSAWVDPRGFSMDWNRTKQMDMGNGKGVLPGFGKPIFPGSAFPSHITGLSGANSYGSPPFTGKPVSALGPYGPFTVEDDMLASNGYKLNTTLMGPLPFGPYGGSPYVPFSGGQLPQQAGMMAGSGMIPHMNGMMGGMMGQGSNPGAGMMGGLQGPMAGFGGGAPMVGSLPGQVFPGLHPTHNPFTAMHHATQFVNMGEGMAPPPGLTTPMGLGYPSPASDRYGSVIQIPPGPFGGGEAAAAA
jgi:hypothetical protein